MSSEEEDWGNYVDSEDEGSEGEEESENEVENMFYEAEDLKNSDYKKAIEQYELVITMEEHSSDKEYTSKCISEIIKLIVKNKDFDNLEKSVRKMLTSMNTMSKFERRTTIDNIFTSINKMGDVSKQRSILETLVKYLKEKKMEDLWMNTCQRLAKIYLMGSDEKNFVKIIKEIKDSNIYKNINLSSSDLKGISIYADLSAIEILFLLQKGDIDELRKVNDELVRNKVADLCGSDPKVLGSLKEAEGRLALVDYDFEEAEHCFKLAFQHYHETGHTRTTEMLKYNTLANILAGMSIDPFDSPETKIFIEDEMLSPFKELWQAYFKKNHIEFLYLLLNKTGLEKEAYGKRFIPELKKAILQEFIKKIVQSYRSLSLDYLSEELKLPRSSVCHILTEMINNKLINGLLDDVEGIFDNHEFLVDTEQRDQINRLHKILNNVQKVF